MEKEPPHTLAQAYENISSAICSYRRTVIHSNETVQHSLSMVAGYVYNEIWDVYIEEPNTEIILFSTLLMMLHGLNPETDLFVWKALQERLQKHDLEAMLSHLEEYERNQVKANLRLLEKYFTQLNS